ncbi:MULTISPECIES: HNH endonuclease [unclassified Nocardiopsis]|uniref:HNH endonuclease n=1 Tax=unclassified Nocardiopsis TaxID=2649073 RepID=UPI0018FE27F5|nr:HNH endonuclease [Nocardiopsis sp. TSRI0078]
MTHIVITTDTDDCYHTSEECAAFRASHATNEAQAKGRRRIVRITVADAEGFGRRPCTVCGAQERANAEQPKFLRELLADLSPAEKRRRQAWIRRERTRANGPVERFTTREIGDRDGWVCGLCHDPVDPSYKVRDPRSPSVDHIRAVSLGGTQTRDNVRITHLGCNHERNNSTELLNLEDARRVQEIIDQVLGVKRQATTAELEAALEHSREQHHPDQYRQSLRRAVQKYERGGRDSSQPT